MLLSPWIPGLYGGGFRSDWDILVLLAASAIAQAVNDVVIQVVTCKERMWWIVLIHVVWAGQLVGMAYLLVPGHGVRGFVWSFLAATAVHLALNVGAATILVWRDAKSSKRAPRMLT